MSVVILFLVMVVSGGNGKRMRLTHVHFESNDDEKAIIMRSYEDPKIAGYPVRGETPLLMVSFQVGSAQMPQYTVVDSGSSRIWLACEINYKTEQRCRARGCSTSTSFRTLEC